MPIDPSIALQGKPVQFDIQGPINLMNQGRQMQMQQQQLRMQQEAHAQQMQTGAITLQQQKQALADDAAGRQLFSSIQAGGAMPSDAEILGKLGPVHGSTIVKGLREADKSRADLQKTKGEVAVQEQDYAGGLAAMVAGSGYSPDALKVAIQHAHASGYEQEAQQLQQLLQADPATVKTAMDQLIAQSPAQQKLINERTSAQAAADSAGARVKGAETGEKRLTAELPGIDAGNTIKTQEATGTKPIQPAEAARIEGEAAGRQETANFHRQTVSQGAQRIGLAAQANQIHAAEADPYGQLGVNAHPAGGGQTPNAHGDEFLQTLPSVLAAKVKAVAEGRQPMPNARGGVLRGEGKAISDAVYQYDPEFSTQRADIRKAFTTGKAGDNIGALNTATVHLDQLGEVAKAMQNNSFRPGNELFNRVKTIFGDATPTNFEGLKSAVAGEMANALKGNATDPEIANISKSLQAASSPEQLSGVIDTHLHTLAAKLNTYQERYRQQSPNDKAYSPVLPSAGAVYQKHGISSGNNGAALPQGGGKVLDPATAQQFYDAAGKDPVKARKMAADAGWKVQ